MCCNRRPVALDHPPVDATVVVATDIPRRDPIELRPVRVRADRIDPGIPLAARLEKRRGRNVRLLLGAGMKLLVEFLQRLQKAGLLRERKADRSRTPRPRRRRLVDQAALCLGNVSPGIAIGRMQPTAAEIDWKCRISAHRPRASAEPRACLHDETIDMRVHEPPACCDTSRAAAHNYDLGIAIGHALFRGDLDRDVRYDRATERAVPTMRVHVISLPILSPRSRRQQRPFAPTKSTPTRALSAAGLREPFAPRDVDIYAPQLREELPFASGHSDHRRVRWRAPASVALAQPTENTSPEQGTTCPPDVKGEPPTVGGGSSAPLSDKLAQSKGVICPPAGIDRDMQVTPPGGGHLKVIPPPGTPGGDPNVQPK